MLSSCGSFAIALTVWCGVLGYYAFMLINLVGSIKALANKGDSTCTTGAFKWIWWICCSSVLFMIGMLQEQKKYAECEKVADVGVVLFVYFACSLGFALGTQFEYLDGCDGPAHTVMFVYMWGHYAVAALIALVSSCFAIGAMCETKKQEPTDLAAFYIAAQAGETAGAETAGAETD